MTPTTEQGTPGNRWVAALKYLLCHPLLSCVGQCNYYLCMYATKNFTLVSPRIKKVVEYEEKEGLFGLLRWYEVVKTTEIGRELHIVSSELIKTIIVNGEVFIKE